MRLTLALVYEVVPKGGERLAALSTHISQAARVTSSCKQANSFSTHNSKEDDIIFSILGTVDSFSNLQ